MPETCALASLSPLPAPHPYFFWFLSDSQFKMKAFKTTFSASPFLGICIGIRGVNLVSKRSTSARGFPSFLLGLPQGCERRTAPRSLASAQTTLLSATGDGLF